MDETHHRWRFQMLPLSLRTTEYRDRVEPMTRIIPRRLKLSCVGYCPGFQNLRAEEIDIVTETDDVLPPSDDNDDDYDFLLGEADLFLSDDSIPPGIENVADDPEGDIRFLEELLINDSILSYESSDSNFEDNP
nr:hypothetical protein [Tanacetum cinerariifolium]